eukprot:TRINITY_DN29493_c0_g1_i1.p2 TRINITY_DN29493_c0_g1~~TRINITY_DN29493_c0_g1_i1.p2  ORF type:complete len:255 (+),score=47.17 TRINITY_DN29493_c0_g1_i1:317-1081(+)
MVLLSRASHHSEAIAEFGSCMLSSCGRTGAVELTEEWSNQLLIRMHGVERGMALGGMAGEYPWQTALCSTLYHWFVRPLNFGHQLLVAPAAVVVPHRRRGTMEEILITQRATRSGGTYNGMWVFPGGHVDANERSVAEAAAREVLEETGLQVENLKPIGVWQAQQVRQMRQYAMIVFVGEVVGDEAVKLQEEEVECAAWVPREHAARLLPPAADVPDVQLLSYGPGAPASFASIQRGLGGGHQFALREWLKSAQ